MAYILGFIYADGTIYVSSRGKYLVVTNTDGVVISAIKKHLDSTHKIIIRDLEPPRKSQFILRIGNKNLYNSLTLRGLCPNKSLTARLPIIPQKFLSNFLLGYFDGDGCVNLYRTKGTRKKLIMRKLSVIFTSGSKAFLEDIIKVLRKSVALKQSVVYASHRSFQLRFATFDSVALFKFFYKNAPKDLLFRRKFKVFQKYFELRPQKIDSGIRKIIKTTRTSGHVVK